MEFLNEFERHAPIKRALAGIALAVSAAALAQSPYAPVYVHNGFMNGNHYRELPDLMRRFYVAGVVDGLFAAPLVAARDLPAAQRLGDCIERMHATDEQMTVIVDRFLDANPVRWGESMNTVMWSAISAACRTAGTPVVPTN